MRLFYKISLITTCLTGLVPQAFADDDAQRDCLARCQQAYGAALAACDGEYLLPGGDPIGTQEEHDQCTAAAADDYNACEADCLPDSPPLLL